MSAPPGVAERLLFQEARSLARQAYAPYSGYGVGAVVVGPSGRSHHGVNVENAASPAGLCAERAALAAMIAFGEQELRFVAVAAADGSDCLPCGLCLQALAEFGDPAVIAVAGGALTVRRLSELLTTPFRLRPAGRDDDEAGDGHEGRDDGGGAAGAGAGA